MRRTIGLACCFVVAACANSTIDPGAQPDLSTGGGGNEDLTGGQTGSPDLTGGAPDLAEKPNACGTFEPGCTQSFFGPPQFPFPLQGDPNPRPGQTDNGVDRDPNGFLVLSSSKSSFDFLWIANSEDWGRGSVSKVNSKTVKEVARYFSVTCFSNPNGSRAACNGQVGCCSRDDFSDFTYRQQNNGASSNLHQAVQQTKNNPSRTAVDFNGDVWVSNRAFGGQSSVTKIANDMSECRERNGTPGIQTSSDTNADGVIDTDCNGNGVADDVLDVRGKACTNGRQQEFYGFDDECVLFTTNTNRNDLWGRPLALGRGASVTGASDAWAGTFKDGSFFRVDGTTGLVKTQARLPQGFTPYGAIVDLKGILWAVNLGGGLAYIDTANPAQNSRTRNPSFVLGGYGITLDRDQNLWMGGYPHGHAYRYAPDRSAGFDRLGQGYWTVVTSVGAAAGANDSGRGVAADSRTPTAHWVWLARTGGWIGRIPASQIAVPRNGDNSVDGSQLLAIRVAGGRNGSDVIGVGLDADQNVWGIERLGAVATRIKVDQNAQPTLPDITQGQTEMGCPVGGGDRCTLGLMGRATDPQPYTYSDFTGFGLRNFTTPKGFWQWTQSGCPGQDTRWVKIEWTADTPPNTSVTVRARSGMGGGVWGNWTGDYPQSPADLKLAPGPLDPNPANNLQIEVDLSSNDRAATPRLKSVTIIYECGTRPG